MSPRSISPRASVSYEQVLGKKTEYLNKNKKWFMGEFETPILWTNFSLFVILHIVALYAFITVPWYRKPGLVLYAYTLHSIAMFGITAGAHRLWSHRSYKAKLPLEIILLFCYSVAGQNNLKKWVLDHRVHHKYTDTNADPHNAHRGFLFSHVGWLFMQRHPEVSQKMSQIDVSDLLNDPVVFFHIKNWPWIKLLTCFILPAFIPPLFWGETVLDTILFAVVLRWVINMHCVFTVNSIAHAWGYKPYDKNILPSENGLVSLMTMGEGWHNYHHTFPWDYRTAEWARGLNLTAKLLDIFARIGWAYDLKSASPELIQRVIQNRGGNTDHPEEIKYEECQTILKNS